jgi:hypothetical protein
MRFQARPQISRPRCHITGEDLLRVESGCVARSPRVALAEGRIGRASRHLRRRPTKLKRHSFSIGSARAEAPSDCKRACRSCSRAQEAVEAAEDGDPIEPCLEPLLDRLCLAIGIDSTQLGGRGVVEEPVGAARGLM